MSKDKKKLKKILKNSLTKVNNNDSVKSSYKFELFDFTPTSMYIPDKYYTAKMGYNPSVQYLNEGDIIIIDPSIKEVRESGIYIFEFNGYILVRQFQILPFGKDDYKKIMYRSVSKSDNEECFKKDEVNILGAVISKQVELFHSLYGITKSA